ncbi:MAG: Ig domain-containing protein [Eubacteriales bacterium]
MKNSSGSLLKEGVSSSDYFFTSSNPLIVSVTGEGLLYALEIGEAEILIQSVHTGSVVGSCKIFVLDPAQAGTDSENSPAPSEDTGSLSKTSNNGSGGDSPSVPTDVPPVEIIPVEGLELIGPTDQFVGKSYRYTYRPYPENANEKCIFESDNPEVCQIDQSGLAVAKASGSTVIRIRTEDSRILHEFPVEIHNYVKGLTILQAPTLLYTGETVELFAQILPEGTVNKGVYWVNDSENKSVLSLSPDGLSCKITALAPTGTGYASVTLISADFPDSLSYTIWFRIVDKE